MEQPDNKPDAFNPETGEIYDHKTAAAECGSSLPIATEAQADEAGIREQSDTDELQGTLSPAEESARLALPVEQSSPEELQRACNQIEKDFPPDPDALWRAGLEAEMRPIAQRAGRKLFTLCASINNAHVGLGLIAQVAQQTKTTLIQLHARQAAAAVVQRLHHTSVVLDQAIAALINGCAEASGFTREQIVEVQTDMLRARQLAQAAPPSGIVLPGGGH